MNNQRPDRLQRHYLLLICIFGFFLVFSPVTSFIQDLLTKLMKMTGISFLITRVIVPQELIITSCILYWFKVKSTMLKDGKTLILHKADKTEFNLQVTWGCIGWESLLCLIITFVAGMDGKYTWESRRIMIIVGVFGTVAVNLLRIILTAFMGLGFGYRFTVSYHTYLGTALYFLWLVVYWWVGYGFILQRKEHLPEDIYGAYE